MEHDGRETFGQYFESLQVGDVYKHWPGVTITDTMNTWFCFLTMNHNPVHFDAEYAKTHHKDGRKLVVGTLVFSMVVAMSIPQVSGKAIANLRYDEVVHTAPVFVGDTIYAEAKVLEKREASKGGRGVVKLGHRAWNQRGETVLTFTRDVLLPKRNYTASSVQRW